MNIVEAKQGLTWKDFAKVARRKDLARHSPAGIERIQAAARRERRRVLEILQGSHAEVAPDALHAVARGWSESEYVLFRKERNLDAILLACRHVRDADDAPALHGNAQQMLARLRTVLSGSLLNTSYRSGGAFRKIPEDWTVAQLITHLQQQHVAVRQKIAERIATDPGCSFITAPYNDAVCAALSDGAAVHEMAPDESRRS